MSKKDWTTDERKLQMVYEDLQTGRYKPALGQLDRHLRKSPSSQPALVLRAYARSKLGFDVPVTLADWEKAKKAGELSPKSLWWSQLFLREIDRLDKLLEIYQDLWTLRPKNDDLGEQVFLVATSCWDVPAMNAASRKMFNNSKSAVWARVAAWTEWITKCSANLPTTSQPFGGIAPPGELRTATMLLGLTNNEVPSAEVLWLHVQIRLAAGQEEEALGIVRLEGKGGGGVGRIWWRMQTMKEVVKRKRARGEDTEEVVAREMREFSELLERNDDMQRNWACYEHLVHLATTSDVSHQRTLRILLERLEAAIGDKERAPTLALLSLDKEVEGWKSKLSRYWKRWGSKGVVLDDLPMVWQGRKDEVREMLQCCTSHDTISAYYTVKHATLLLLRLDRDTWQPSLDEFQRLSALYTSGHVYCANIPKTDVKPNDELGLAASQVLIHLWSQSNDEAYLLRAVLCLREIIHHSPACAHARYLLMPVYRLLGAFNLIPHQLDKLNFAEVQLDTLLWVFFEQGAGDAIVGEMEETFATWKAKAEAMYQRTARDLPEYAKQATENESFSQVTNIRELARSLAHSLSAASLGVEAIRMDVLKKAEYLLASSHLSQAINSAAPVDNRSRELLPAFAGQDVPIPWSTTRGSLNARWQVYEALRTLLRGQSLARIDPSEMSPAEGSMLMGISRLLNTVYMLVPDASNGSVPQMTSPEDVYQDLLRIALEPTPRYERLCASIHLVELRRLVDRVLGQLHNLVGKNHVEQMRLSAPVKAAMLKLVEQVREVQAGLADGMKQVAKSWEGMGKDDALFGSAQLTGLESDEEGHARTEAWKTEIQASQDAALSNLTRLLMGKK